MEGKQAVLADEAEPLSFEFGVGLCTESRPDLVPGLDDEGVIDLAWFDLVALIQPAQDGVSEGAVLKLIVETPYQCPPSPFEYALLFDEVLRQRGVREQDRLTVAHFEP